MTQKKQITTIVALLIAVVTISIGFALFSNSLNITSQATVSPDSGKFRVIFASNEAGTQTSDIVPSKTPNTITATNASIENTSNPTISNLSAVFTSPGQKAEYTFYVHNAGAYIAHLNSITYKGEKSCTPASGTNATYVANACNAISMKVEVDGVSVTGTRQNISNKTLAVGESKLVKVTLEYASNGARADGNFTVTFPDVSMYYVTVGGVNENWVEPPTYNTTGGCDEVVIGTEKFCTLSETSTTKTLIAQKNITLSTTNPIQSDNLSTKEFSNSLTNANYWWDGENDAFSSSYPIATGDTYPYVYDYKSYLFNYVDAYKTKLQTINSNIQSARLASYEEMAAIGSRTDIRNTILANISNSDAQLYLESEGIENIETTNNSYMIMGMLWNYNEFTNLDKAKLALYGTTIQNPLMDIMMANNLSVPSWARGDNYWLGSAYSGEYVWYMSSLGSVKFDDYDIGDDFGIRPVITVLK